jgi:hypothetical protein
MKGGIFSLSGENGVVKRCFAGEKKLTPFENILYTKNIR